MPKSMPAPSAATMPLIALPDPPAGWRAVAKARMVAPKTIAAAPPSTFAQSRAREPRNSLKSTQPQRTPTKLLVFHRGNAMASPTLRTAKMVSVLATAQSIPASSAHAIKCG